MTVGVRVRVTDRVRATVKLRVSFRIKAMTKEYNI